MAFCRLDADSAVYRAFADLNPVSNSIPVDGKVLALATLNAWVASFTELLVIKKSRRGRRQRYCTDPFAELLPKVRNQLMDYVRQFLQ